MSYEAILETLLTSGVPQSTAEIIAQLTYGENTGVRVLSDRTPQEQALIKKMAEENLNND